MSAEAVTTTAGDAARRVLLASGGTVIGRVAMFAQFGLVTLLTRGLDRNVFAWTFTVVNVALVASSVDRGVGAVVVGLASRGEPIRRLLELTRPMRVKLRRTSVVVAGVLFVGELAVLGRGSTRLSTLVGLLVLQTVAIVAILGLVPYERTAYGQQRVGLIARATLVSVLITSAVGLLCAGSGIPVLRDIAPALILMMQPVTARAIMFRSVMSEAAPAISSAATADETKDRLLVESRHFFVIQMAWTASIGIDQLLVSLLRPESQAVEFAAHARWFLLAQAVVTVVSANVWPVISSTLAKGSVDVARRVFAWATVAVVSASIVIALPPLVGLVPPGLFLMGATYRQSLLIPMMLSFVVMQWGQLLGQVQAAVRDVRFQSQVIVPATIANVVASVVLCLVIGPEGAPWGTVLSYPVVLVLGSMRLANPAVWQRSAALSEEAGCGDRRFMCCVTSTDRH